MRWYPRRWRQEHEDAALGMLLDDAVHRRITEPSAQDRASLIRAGLRERFLSFERVPRFNRVALAGGVVFALFYGIVVAWAPGASWPGAVLSFSNPFVLVGVVMLLSWACAMLSAGRSARALAWIAAAAAVTLAMLASLEGWMGPGVEAASVSVAFSIAGSLRMQSIAAMFRRWGDASKPL